MAKKPHTFATVHAIRRAKDPVAYSEEQAHAARCLAANMTPEQRSKRARKAALARYAKAKAAKGKA